jgi:hypothetical protein
MAAVEAKAQSDRQRVEFLFTLNERYTAPLLPVTEKTRRRGGARAGQEWSRRSIGPTGQTHLNFSLFFLFWLSMVFRWGSAFVAKREKRRRAGYRLPPHSKTLPPGRTFFGVRWQAKRDTALWCKNKSQNRKSV